MPFSKIYRAFPELDRFSDGECEKFVRLAMRRRRLSEVGYVFGALAAAAAAVGVWVLCGVVFNGLIPHRSFFWESGPGLLIAMLYAIMGPVSAAMAALMVRDSWLHKSVSLQLSDTRCLACRYSLLGLEVVNGAVRCPECGEVRRLSESNLTAQQLMSRPAQAP